MTLADLNGDGYPDIVAFNRADYPDLVDGKPGKGRQVPTPSDVCLNGFALSEGRSGRSQHCPGIPNHWKDLATP